MNAISERERKGHQLAEVCRGFGWSYSLPGQIQFGEPVVNIPAVGDIFVFLDKEPDYVNLEVRASVDPDLLSGLIHDFWKRLEGSLPSEVKSEAAPWIVGGGIIFKVKVIRKDAVRANVYVQDMIYVAKQLEMYYQRLQTLAERMMQHIQAVSIES